MIGALLLIPNIAGNIFKFFIWSTTINTLANQIGGTNFTNTWMTKLTDLVTAATFLLHNIKYYLSYIFYFVPYDFFKPLLSLVLAFFIWRLVFAATRIVGNAT